MADGIQTVEEAFAAARLELQPNGAALEEGVGAQPEIPQPPPDVAQDQPSEADPETQALIDSLTEQPAEADLWSTEVEVNGSTMTLGEMRNGYLRHADYTRKTQALADERRDLGKAEQMYKVFMEDPGEFARALAVEFGWIDSQLAAPIRDIEFTKPPTQEELDKRVEEMLEERVASDPSVQEAKRIEALALVHEEFDRIEGVIHASIPPQLRESLIAEAQQRQVYDLELLLRARLSTGNQRTSDDLTRSGAARPSSRGVLGQAAEPVAQPTTFEEAWAQAKAEAGH